VNVDKGTAETEHLQAGSYTIGRIPVKVTADSAQLLGPLHGILRPWAAGEAENPFHLHVRYGSEPSSWRGESLRLFWGGMLRSGVQGEYYAAAGRRIVHLPERAWGRLDFEQRVVEIVCGPGQEGCAYDGCLIPLLCELLAYQGHYVIHAASLAFERQGESGGILLAGVSGAGKTTAALALAHAGMMLLSDDTSFVESPGPNGSKVGLWGLQLPCKVHDNTRRLLPWLDMCPATAARTGQETRMDVTAAVGDSTGIVADSRLVLLLGPRSGSRHVLERLDRAQAMMQLTSENIRAYEHRANGTAGNAFRALGQLVAQCDVYRLSVGVSLADLAEQILSLPGRCA
jgi:hypothetical protein